MRALVSRLLVATALLSAPAALSAHRQWLLPSTTIVSGTDNWVTVDAAVSNDLFYPDHFPMQTESIQVWQPDGSTGAIQNAAKGRYRSTFDVQLDKPGTWKIGTASTNVSGSFKLNGEDWTVGRRRGPPRGPEGAGRPAHSVATAADIPAGATDVKLTEMSSRNEIFVTAGEPTATVLKPTGKGLDMEPVTHPDSLVSNEPARFRFLIDGKPAAGLKVTLIPGGKRYRDSEGVMELATGADGVLEVKWPAPGMYWLNATTTDNHPATPRATERRMSYTSTLEVMAP
ncbi:DUF4198 domain-containing protein [Sphingomonas oligoaromativorans]|jgi:uncharacterized GH25 family protein|uniref:DUF4198 domain-containing protein n=1 Tax=Sphingomonas oligoaromativorans TaxID=575322 RepID=UPI00141EE75D|nr:DUF4198 domain-containing protein [Sphingomonas oligoaromativorans]NIJ31665.1 putative GH25 family protein [Sphingomonas oligoaromativorans]